MKHLLKILTLLIACNCYGQSSINNAGLDTLGLLKWNITFMTPDLEITRPVCRRQLHNFR